MGDVGLDVDGADLCRLVIDRTDRDIIETFNIPNLTDDQVTIIMNMSAKLGGGRRKKRRSGKKLKAKCAKTHALLRKMEQKTLNKKH